MEITKNRKTIMLIGITLKGTKLKNWRRNFNVYKLKREKIICTLFFINDRKY